MTAADLALYPVAEVARLFRCSREHVYELIRHRRIATVNIATSGKPKTRITESALKAYMRSLGAGTEPPAGPQQPTNPTKPRSTRKG